MVNERLRVPSSVKESMSHGVVELPGFKFYEKWIMSKMRIADSGKEKEEEEEEEDKNAHAVTKHVDTAAATVTATV